MEGFTLSLQLTTREIARYAREIINHANVVCHSNLCLLESPRHPSLPFSHHRSSALSLSVHPVRWFRVVLFSLSIVCRIVPFFCFVLSFTQSADASLEYSEWQDSDWIPQVEFATDKKKGYFEQGRVTGGMGMPALGFALLVLATLQSRTAAFGALTTPTTNSPRTTVSFCLVGGYTPRPPLARSSFERRASTMDANEEMEQLDTVSEVMYTRACKGGGMVLFFP